MAQGHHHPADGVIGPAWLHFPLLEECQLFSEEEVFCSQRAAGPRRRQNESAKLAQDRSCRLKTVLQRGKEEE
jgi:hypothetical protein